MMRMLAVLAPAAFAAGCGQTGALYLPDKGIETPVEIRGPEATPPAPAPAEDEKEKKEDKATQPPGR